MQFSLWTSTLLAGFLMLHSLQTVDSLSVSNRSPESQILTLPLRRIKPRSDIHPQVLLQMHINRSIYQLAKMTGAELPSVQSLEQRIEKRLVSLDVPTGSPRKRQTVVPNPPTASNSLGLYIYGYDAGYLAEIQIGTPPKIFKMRIDSATADFWVGSEESCATIDPHDSDSSCGSHSFLGKTSSSTFVDTAKPWSMSYQAGQVNGTICQDIVVVAGLTLPNFNFGVATLQSSAFTSNPSSDGLLGTAKSDPPGQGQGNPTVIDSLASAGYIPAIVSYKLGRETDGNDGEITFGALDPTRFNPSTLVTLKNANNYGGYGAFLDTDGISVDGVTLLSISGVSTNFDTGSQVIYLPGIQSVSLHQKIPGAVSDEPGVFKIPCDTTASVGFKYGGQIFTIDPRDLVSPSVDGSGYCASNFVGDPNSFNSPWIVGDVFLKNVYFSTDAANNSVSLAKLV